MIERVPRTFKLNNHSSVGEWNYINQVQVQIMQGTRLTTGGYSKNQLTQDPINMSSWLTSWPQ